MLSNLNYDEIRYLGNIYTESDLQENSNSSTVAAEVTSKLNDSNEIPYSGWSLYSPYTSFENIRSTEDGLDVAMFQKGDEIVLFAKGSDLSPADVLNNFSIGSDEIPASVFRMVNLYKQVEQLNAGNNVKIVLAGHSIGASIAEMAGAILQSESEYYYQNVEVAAYAPAAVQPVLNNLGLNPNTSNFATFYSALDAITAQYANANLNIGNVYYTEPTAYPSANAFEFYMSKINSVQNLFDLLNNSREDHNLDSYQDFVKILDSQHNLENINPLATSQSVGTYLSQQIPSQAKLATLYQEWQHEVYSREGSIDLIPNGPKLVSGTGGDDYLVGSTNISKNTVSNGSFFSLDRTQFHDSINGLGGNDVLFGDKGNDTLDGGDGNDTLYGSLGKDEFLFFKGGDQDKIINTFGENDSLVISGTSPSEPVKRSDITLAYKKQYDIQGNEQTAHDNLVISINNTLDSITVVDQFKNPQTNMGIEHISLVDGTIKVGTLGNDANKTALVGQINTNNYIYGFDGNDEIKGDSVGTGNDYLDGGSGDDTISGYAGNDTLIGGIGNDTYKYKIGDGNDIIKESGNKNESNVLDLSTSFSESDLNISTTTSDKIITFTGQSGSVTIKDYVSNSVIIRTKSGDFGSDLSETYIGTAGNDNYYAAGGNDTAFGDNIQSEQMIGGNDSLKGGTGDDLLFGEGKLAFTYDEFDQFVFQFQGGNDTLAGGDGNDALIGDGLEFNISHIDSGGNTVDFIGKFGDDYLDGGNGDDILTADLGDLYNDNPVGIYRFDMSQIQAGNNTLVGGTGNDTLNGGLGNDQYVFNSGDGDDVIKEISTDDQNIHGGGFDQIIFGTGIKKSDITFTNDGNDKVISYGNSSIRITNQNIDSIIDVIKFNDGSTLDHYEFRNDIQLNVYGTIVSGENLTGSSGVDYLHGNVGSDTLNAGNGDDFLDGGEGNDSLSGGNGNDVYIFKSENWGNDTISDAGGNDTLDFSFLSAGTTIALGIGLSGSLHVGTGTKTVSWSSVNIENALGSQGNDLITGNSSDNLLVGNSGNDTLNGGGGNDTLNGGVGDDTYVLSGDWGSVQINDSSGLSTIDLSSQTSDLSIDLQNFSGSQLTMGSNTMNFSGSLGSLRLGSGNDTVQLGFSVQTAKIEGGAGNDTLIGSWVDDTLDGGSGADSMAGAGGNDTYIVDSTLDVVTEDQPFSGNDTVEASVSYTLGTNLENLTLTGSGNLNGTGNNLDNIIRGNSGNNILTGDDGNDVLDGISGDDTMIGGSGDDLYFVNSTTDVVTELAEQGVDTVQASISYTLNSNVENLTLIGTSNLNATGNSLDNLLYGNDGNNVLDGDVGSDTLIGGTGNDTYYVNLIDDVVIEKANEGIDTVISSAEAYTVSTNVENLTLAEGIALNAAGNDLDNILIGNSNNNILFGNAGNDTLIGNAGNDLYLGLSSTSGADIIQDNSGSLDSASFTGIMTNQVTWSAIDTNSDTFVDRLLVELGNGNSVAISNYFDNTATTAGNSGQGTGLIESLLFDDDSDVTFNEVQSLLAASAKPSSGNDNLIGTSDADLIDALGGNDTVSGLAGDDTLNGDAGVDMLVGGLGNDTYIVDNVSDLLIENLGEGTDIVQSSVSYTLANNLESLTLTGSSAINGTGNTLNNVITGNSGNNILNGGAGVDTLNGGLGNDTYIVDSTTDTITENASEGTDTVQSSVTYTLGSNLENLTLTGTTAINGTGNTLNNSLVGNSANNNLTAGAGNDTLDGGAGIDTLIGGTGNDTYVVDSTTDTIIENTSAGTDLVQSSVTYTMGTNLENLTLTGTAAINGTGNSLNNIITGNSGNNILTGGAGVDTLIGGLGNDTYVVDSTTDIITEASSAGTDTVQTSVIYTLGANLENLTLTGTTAINGTGNSLNNLLNGNSANNNLTGGAGDDTLNGGAGIDTLVGGTGNDTYIVDSTTDVITENASEGTDLVQSSVTYTLGNNLENLTLTGTTSINGTGNSLNNIITGNSGNNSLRGGAGDDTMDGGAGTDTLVGSTGNDTYIVDSTTDTITENANEGTDLVQSSVTYTLGSNLENLTLTGTAAINATGNSFNNVLTGNSGNNTLDGGSGADSLSGGDGNDTLIGGAGNDSLNGGNGNDLYLITVPGWGVDTITGDTSGADTIDLSGMIDNITANFVTTGTKIVSGADSINWTGDLIENVITGWGNDNITGNTLSNLINGGVGKDTILSGAGNDTLIGGASNDNLDGGDGNDLYVFSDAWGNDTITGDASGIDTLDFSAVSSNLTVDLDTTGTEVADLGPNNTVNWSGTFIENVIGGTGWDSITGNSSANLLSGNASADTLIGEAGDDTLIGGTGNDSLIGGTGNDFYQFKLGDGLDVIQENDSTSGNMDHMQFDSAISKAQIAIFKNGNNLEIGYQGDTTDKVTVTNQFTTAGQVERFDLVTGQYMTSVDVNLVIQNMTSYASSHGIALTSLSTVQNDQNLMNIVAAGWHS